MKYNFEDYLNRRSTGSSKWLNMDSRKTGLDENIIPMSVADMEFHTSPEIVESLVDYIGDKTLGYAKPVDSYLDAVVKFFKEYHGYNAKKEWIVTTPGIVSALATSVRAFTDEGDNVGIFTPVYGPFYNVVREQNRNIVECPLIYRDNNYYMDFELFEENIVEKNIKLVLLCSPHNPGGRVWTKEELQEFVRIVEKHDLLVVSDEIHSDIVFNGNRHTVLGSLNETIGNRSIICTAASKSFNIAGLQCSNIFIENENLRNRFIKSNEDIGIDRANVLGLIATEAAYSKGLNWLEEVKNIIYRNNEIVRGFFEGYGDTFKVMKPQASFLVWVNFKNLNISHEKFMEFLDNNCLFFASDGLSFGENGRYFIRINTGLPTKELEKSLNRVKDNLKKNFNI